MYYMDARSSGFDHTHWQQLRDKALSQTYKDKGAAYRCGAPGWRGGGRACPLRLRALHCMGRRASCKAR
jgi:hypothetical protein